ncbi:TetR/AcrR family transcriptional regulator [Archangium minus]|uniref:TetR/AcrR family transcriptional regulator n=2 Tax=Archangiaceae TaxID=39 RepID=A0ABY9XC18_9BACT|nr:TetR/AcrR family transcriptional regulator [Archangium violaceum]WNG52946.1 TetR/AcrR family transcriptional regulator [Archangium minus]
MTGKKTTKPSPRERILEAAEELFYREGIRGVGVEAIAARAETTKMALYRHFESKDALVAEWLRLMAAQDEAVFDRLESEHPGDPRAQLLGWAQVIAGRLSEGYRGCPLINSLAELPDKNHPARQVIEAHKARHARKLAALCTLAGIPEPEAAASEILFVLEGAQVSAQCMGAAKVGERLMRIVKAIVDGKGG